MNRTFSLTVVGLLAASVLVPLSAVADDGLTIWVFAGPDTAGLGEDVTVNVEAYYYDQPVDLDTLDVSAGLNSTAVTMTHAATGKYHGTYTIESLDAQYGFFTVQASGDSNSLYASDSQYMFLGSGGGSGGWDMAVRLGDYGQMPLGVGPGTSVLIEARTYYDGTVAEGGAVNLTIVTAAYGGTNQNTEHVTMTKVSDGVYHHTIQVPASITNTQAYSLDFELGPSGDLASDSMSFTAQPFSVLTSVTNKTATSADVQVLAGLETPIAGANVTITGTQIIMAPPYVLTFGPFTGTTGADGSAKIHVNWTGSAPSTLETIVSASGKNVGFPLVLSGSSGTGWQPTAPLPYGCDAQLQTNPQTVEVGTTAHLTYRVTYDGDALASTEVSVFSGDASAYGWATAANKTTDANGDITVDFAVPAMWSFFDDMFDVGVVCPSGEVARDSENLGSPGEMYSTVDVTVTAAGSVAAGGDLAVSVQYTGSMPVAGAYGFALLVPGDDPTAFVGALAAGAVGTNLSSTGGGAFTGTIHVPGGMPVGNYSLFVFVTNMGATAHRADEFQQGGFRSVTMTANTGGNNNGGNNNGGNNQNGTGNNGTGQNNTGDTGSGGGFMPGFEAAVVAAAVTAVAAGLAGSRRRKEA